MLSRVCLILTAWGPCSSACSREESTRIKDPDLPMPAEQCIMAGPTSFSRDPDSRTAPKNWRKVSGEVGTPKSGQVVYWKCKTVLVSPWKKILCKTLLFNRRKKLKFLKLKKISKRILPNFLLQTQFNDFLSRIFFKESKLNMWLKMLPVKLSISLRIY